MNKTTAVLRKPLIAALTALICSAVIPPGFSGTAFAQGDTAGPVRVGAVDPTGAIGWIEFASSDLAKSEAFYSAVFGWDFEPFSDDYATYAPPAGVLGGFRLEPEAGSPPVLPFLLTPDVTAMSVAVEAAGGEIALPTKEVGNGGHVAVFIDPAGNAFGLGDRMTDLGYSPDPFGDPSALIPSAICSIEIFGGDFAKTSAFYSDLFGWTLEKPVDTYMGFYAGPSISGVFQNHTPDISCLPYIWVDDASAALEAIVANGGESLGDPSDGVGAPVFAYFKDPCGVVLGLMAPGKAEAPSDAPGS